MEGQIPRFFNCPHLSLSSIYYTPLCLYKPLLMLIFFHQNLTLLLYHSQLSSFSITSTFSPIPMATVEVTLLNTSLLIFFWHYFICFQFHHHIFILLLFLLLCYLKQETIIHFFSFPYSNDHFFFLIAATWDLINVYITLSKEIEV